MSPVYIYSYWCIYFFAGFPQLYLYMFSQRKKIIGTSAQKEKKSSWIEVNSAK